VEHIENRTFDEINIGDTATLDRTLTEQDITLFAVMSGDINPAHVDPSTPRAAASASDRPWHVERRADLDRARHRVPGPGTIYLGQNLRFKRPVKVGDTITIKVTPRRRTPRRARWCSTPSA